MVEVASGVGGRDVGEEPAADPAAAAREGGGLAPIALRGRLVDRDRSALPELRLASLAAKAANVSACVGAARIPADDVEAPAAPPVDFVAQTLDQADAGVARP